MLPNPRSVLLIGGFVFTLTAGDMGVDTVKFSVSNTDPTPPVAAPIPQPQPPVVSLTCNPCDVSGSIMNYRTLSLTINLSASCSSGNCQTTWFYSGNSFFNKGNLGTSYTYTSFCSFVYNYTGEIWVSVTDSATGLSTTSIKKPVSMRCN